MAYVIMLAYTAWAIYAGFKFMSGRSEWLERDAPLNRIVKILVSVAVGYVIGAFYLVYMIFKFIFSLAR